MIFFLLCASPFGAGMPNPGERLGFNLVCKKCSPQNYKRGGGGKSQVGGFCPNKKNNPPPIFPPFFPVFPPFFLRFSPFFPVFPRFREPNADWVREPWTPAPAFPTGYIMSSTVRCVTSSAVRYMLSSAVRCMTSSAVRYMTSSAVRCITSSAVRYTLSSAVRRSCFEPLHCVDPGGRVAVQARRFCRQGSTV